MLLVWLVFLIAVPVWAWSKIDKVDAFPSGDRPDKQPGTTYLLVGSDSRENLSKEQRKRLGTGNAARPADGHDHAAARRQRADLLLSIPRDSLVPIPGHGTTKINAAFAFGGPKLLVKTIEQNTGVRIDHYVEIGFGGFVNSVDAVGGITICPKSSWSTSWPTCTMKKGCHHADGSPRSPTRAPGTRHAARRHRPRAEPAQGDRQVGDKVKSPWTVINPVRYFRVADAGAGSLTDQQGHRRRWRWASSRWAMTRVDGRRPHLLDADQRPRGALGPRRAPSPCSSW